MDPNKKNYFNSSSSNSSESQKGKKLLEMGLKSSSQVDSSNRVETTINSIAKSN